MFDAISKVLNIAVGGVCYSFNFTLFYLCFNTEIFCASLVDFDWEAFRYYLQTTEITDISNNKKIRCYLHNTGYKWAKASISIVGWQINYSKDH